MIPAHQTGKVNAKVKVNAKKVKAGTYEGTVTVREGGKTVAKVPTLLIVKEPDYPRVTSIDVQDGTTQEPTKLKPIFRREPKSLPSLYMTVILTLSAKPASTKSRIKAINISTGTAKSMVTPHCRQENIICWPMPRTKGNQARC